MLSKGISAPSGLQCSQDSISFSAFLSIAESIRRTFCSSGVGSKNAAHRDSRRAARGCKFPESSPLRTGRENHETKACTRLLPCSRERVMQQGADPTTRRHRATEGGGGCCVPRRSALELRGR